VAFGLDGDALAAANANSRAYLWDATDGLAVTFTHPGSRGVIGVAFDPDDELLAAADANGRATCGIRPAASWLASSPIPAARA
jgi:WD40 repeat protein